MKVDLDQALAILRQQQICAIPTETVYGLAGSAFSSAAVNRIYAAKRRPTNNPLIIHVPDLATAKELAFFDAQALALAEQFWPGPLTLVLPLKSPKIAAPALAGGNLIAVRIPRHPLTLKLLKALDFPLAAPSANRSGKISPTSWEDVAQEFPELPILDGGRCIEGLESTIVMTQPNINILRPGTLLTDHAALGKQDDIIMPGMLSQHYAPNTPVTMYDPTNPVDPTTLVLDFGNQFREINFKLDLSPNANLAEAAFNFFHMLRFLDNKRARNIMVCAIPNTGIGIALNNRLKRIVLKKNH